MKLTCRTYLPLTVQGSQLKLLPLYLHLLKQDLDWANDVANQNLILSEVKRFLLENIEEIERSARMFISGDMSSSCSNAERGYTRLSGSDFIAVAYQTKPAPYHTTITLPDTSTTSQYVNRAHFSINVFVFPKDSSAMDEALALSDL